MKGQRRTQVKGKAAWPAHLPHFLRPVVKDRVRYSIDLPARLSGGPAVDGGIVKEDAISRFQAAQPGHQAV